MKNEMNSSAITFALICSALIAIILLSAAYIIAEADHDCSGHNCPICACIQAAGQTLKQFGTGLTPKGLSVHPLTIPMAIAGLIFTLIYATPVSQKIRMNN